MQFHFNVILNSKVIKVDFLQFRFNWFDYLFIYLFIKFFKIIFYFTLTKINLYSIGSNGSNTLFVPF